LWFKDRRIKTSLLAIGSDCLLLLIKLVVALITGSAALYADALHSGTDMLVSVVLLIGLVVRFRKERLGDANGILLAYRLESILAILVSILILWVPFEIIRGLNAEDKPPVDYIWLGILGVMVAIFLAYTMARLKSKVGEETNSPALEADGYHSYMDMFTSLAVLGSFVGLLIGVDVDAPVAILIAVMVSLAGIELFISGVRSLLKGGELEQSSFFEAVMHSPRFRGIGLSIARYRTHLLVLVAFLVVLGFLGSGFHVVPSGSQGVVSYLGKRQGEVLTEGLHYVAPFPLATVETVPTDYVYRLQVGMDETLWEHSDLLSRYHWQTLGNVNRDKPQHFLTGDEKLLNVGMNLHYRLPNIAVDTYLYENLHATIEAVSASVLSAYLASRPFALGFDANLLAQRLTERLKSAGITIEVLAFIPDKVQPPSAVVRDYHDALAAREQQLQLLQGVEGERIKQMLQSNNHVLQVLSESTISGIEKRLTAEGEAAYFEQVAKSYLQQPLMVELNRRLEVMEKVLPAMDKVLVSPDIATDDRRVWSEAE